MAGVALSLWSQDKYRLDRALDRNDEIDREVARAARADAQKDREEPLGTKEAEA